MGYSKAREWEDYVRRAVVSHPNEIEAVSAFNHLGNRPITRWSEGCTIGECVARQIGRQCGQEPMSLYEFSYKEKRRQAVPV